MGRCLELTILHSFRELQYVLLEQKEVGCDKYNSGLHGMLWLTEVRDKKQIIQWRVSGVFIYIKTSFCYKHGLNRRIYFCASKLKHAY